MTDLRSLRLSRKIRQRDLAKVLEVSVHELSKIERRLVTPSTTILEQAAKFLNANIDGLLEFHLNESKTLLTGEGYTTVVPGESFSIQRRALPDKSRIPIIDLFCGTGGFSHGFELTGQFQVTAGLDLLPDRVRTFSENHDTAVTFCANIQNFDVSALEQVSCKPKVVIGGPPCQGFSSIRPFRTVTEHDSRNNLLKVLP